MRRTHITLITMMAMSLFCVKPAGAQTDPPTQEDLLDDIGILSQTEKDIMLAFGDLVDFIQVWDPLQLVVDGYELTVNALTASVAAVQTSLEELQNLNPFGMILSDNDGVPVAFDAEGNTLPVTIIVPPGADADIHEPLAILTNPMTTGAYDDATSGIDPDAVSTGNDWGNLWVNPTLYNATIAGDVHGLTAADVGLGEVDNTPDLAKPLSNALLAALATKVEQVPPPAAPNAPCSLGDVASSSTHLYVCVGPNSWRRTALEMNW